MPRESKDGGDHAVGALNFGTRPAFFRLWRGKQRVSLQSKNDGLDDGCMTAEIGKNGAHRAPLQQRP